MAADLNQMLLFAAVVAEGSFTAAARTLAQPKSTVSRRIAELEARLGMRLLHRSTRRLSLTDEGAVYYEHCRRIASEADEADRAVTARDAAVRGSVRVTAPLAFADRLAPIAAQFLSAHPGVSLEVRLSDQRLDLVEEGFDLAIRFGPLVDSSLVARRLGATESWVCASPRYLRGRPLPKRPADLRSQECVVHRPGPGRAVWAFERGARKESVPVTGRYVVSSINLAHAGALAGLGIASLPRAWVEDGVQRGRLVRLLPDWTTRRGELHLLYHGGPFVRPAVRALVALVEGAFRADGKSGHLSRRATRAR